MKNYVKFILKTYFFKMSSLLLIFFIDTIISVVSSTQIACDVMCVQCVQKQPPEVFFRKDVLKILLISQENNCVGVSLIKLQGLRPVTLLKRDSNTDFYKHIF